MFRPSSKQCIPSLRIPRVIVRYNPHRINRREPWQGKRGVSSNEDKNEQSSMYSTSHGPRFPIQAAGTLIDKWWNGSRAGVVDVDRPNFDGPVGCRMCGMYSLEPDPWIRQVQVFHIDVKFSVHGQTISYVYTTWIQHALWTENKPETREWSIIVRLLHAGFVRRIRRGGKPNMVSVDKDTCQTCTQVQALPSQQLDPHAGPAVVSGYGMGMGWVPM